MAQEREKAFFEEDDWVIIPQPNKLEFLEPAPEPEPKKGFFKRKAKAAKAETPKAEKAKARNAKEARDPDAPDDEEVVFDVDASRRPTPDERAEFIIMRLEQFIRDGRTVGEGMSFKKWQAMAKTEIAIAIAQSQSEVQKDDPVTRRLLFTAAACLTTIGFWGTAVSLHQTAYLTGALVCGGAGLALLLVAGEWRFRNWRRKKDQQLRMERLANVENLNKRIKKLERELEREEKALNKRLKKVTKEKMDRLTNVPPVPHDDGLD